MHTPVKIEAESLYDDRSLRSMLGITTSMLTTARRAGTLRHVRRGNRTFYKGSWVLAWLEDGSTPASAGEPARGQGVAYASR